MPDQQFEERAAETMRLLWRHAGGRAPELPGRSGLTVDRIVDAALGVADTHGLDGLTMRRVADQLDVSPMTPYSYVPGKTELLDLMVDTVYARMPVQPAEGGGWRERVRSVAEDNRALHRRHPWTLQVSPVRPPLGPGLLAKYERELGAFDGIGLDDVEMDAALAHLLGFVRSAVTVELDAERVASESGADDRRWWAVTAPLLAEVLDEADFPLASRVGSAAGAAHGSAHGMDYVYAFGLARFLDGIETFLDGSA